MSNYQLSKVYQIVCLTTGQKYIGSTTQKTLAVRLAGHNAHFKRWKNGKSPFITSFTVLERGNYQIELLETFPCNSKDELNAREGHYIRMIDCVNKRIEGRTLKEWYEDNKTELAEYRKEYYEDNKTELLEKKKEYYVANKTEITEKKKEYYISNKNEITEKAKEYYVSNKTEKLEKIKAYQKANKAKKAEYCKAYNETNKSKIAEQKKAYYLKKKAEKSQ